MVGAQFDLRIQRGFVRCGNAGELRDFPGAGAGVKTFGIALLAGGERGAEVNFQKLSRGSNPAGQVAPGAIGRDKSGDANDARFGEQFGHFGHAADVFLARGGGEAQVGTEPVPEVVAIQHKHLAAGAEQFPLQFHGEGGFAGGAQAGEPHHAAGVTVLARPFGGRDFAMRRKQRGVFCG